MKKIFILLLSLTLVLFGCGRKAEQNSKQKPERKPVISLAELMIDKITRSADTTKNGSKATVDSLIKLRKYDNQFYKALYKEGNTLSKTYFYARRGSCCPCTAGGMDCCRCSSGAALGVLASVQVSLAEVRGIENQGLVFMQAKMTSFAQVGYSTLALNREKIDGVDLFTVPENTKPGKYKVSFKGDDIDLTLVVEVDADGKIEILDI